MKVKLPSGREVKVWVQHIRTDLHKLKLFDRPLEYTVPPHTVVKLIENDLILSEGTAWCCPSDNFCKKTGIKLALKRAAQVLRDKEDRRALWESVLHLRKGAKVGNGQAIREE